MSYVFSGFDRILGCYGCLHERGGDLVLDDMLVCSTWLTRAPVGAVVNMMRGCLGETEWIREPNKPGDVWRRQPYGITLLPEERAREMHSLNLSLTLGDGLKYLPDHLSNAVTRHERLLGENRATSLACPPRIQSSIAEAVDGLRGLRLSLYTGAGISAAGGIPTFSGIGSMDARCGLHEPFPGEFVAWMLAQPDALARELGEFQAQLLNASPTRAHRRVACLEWAGAVQHVITANIDMLHEQAGCKTVVSPSEFLEQTSMATLDTDAIVVVGVSVDTFGIVAWARSVPLPVFVVDIHPPEFLEPDDCFVQADADSFLDALESGWARCVERSIVLDNEGIPPAADDKDNDLSFPLGRVRSAIPKIAPLLGVVAQRTTSGDSPIHGWPHWAATAQFGLELLSQCPGADPAVVFLFSLTHDVLRREDGHDPQHGWRAARLIDELEGSEILLCDDGRALLVEACEHHSDGYTTEDPTIGACWDADRLCLWRIGVRPDPTGLSLAVSRVPSRIAAARTPMMPRSWEALYEAFARI